MQWQKYGYVAQTSPDLSGLYRRSPNLHRARQPQKRKTGESLPRFLWVCSLIPAAYGFVRRKKRMPAAPAAV